ncbi:MAG: hypothetical protein MUF00_18395 [Gemmatimonadaceae bacterium]|jgi:antitoxin MazE|nr:hypothetical protein [Gemmatimonadaceae bacterium]
MSLSDPLHLKQGPSRNGEIDFTPSSLDSSTVSAPRAGWAEAAAEFQPSPLLDAPDATRFDEYEWTW